MRRDWNAGSQKSDNQSNQTNFSHRAQKSKAERIPIIQDSTISIDNSDFTNNRSAENKSSSEKKSKKLFSDISKQADDSLIRNKSSNINDSDRPFPNSIRIKKISSKQDGANSERKKKKIRKKYVYSTNHLDIKLVLEKSFELEVSRIDPLNSTSHRRKSEHIMEVELPGKHSSQTQKSNKVPAKKQTKRKDNAIKKDQSISKNTENKTNLKVPIRQKSSSKNTNYNDFILVGTGDDMKFVFNISKYYTDLGERVASEVIFNSIKQVKHHDIILPEDDPSKQQENNNKSDENEEKQVFSFDDSNHGNDNFIVVGSGNDMKVILNISKYYTDLGEKIANEVIEKSLSQVKHHGILTEKEKPVNHDNYIFNYSGEQNDDNKKQTNQKFSSLSKNRNNPQNKFTFPSVTEKNQSISQDNYEPQNNNEALAPSQKNGKDYILVGSGDDQKFVFNIAKYYTDLGEKVATEVIFNSLTQIKHHDIILPEDEPSNQNKSNKEEEKSDQSFPQASSEVQKEDQQDFSFNRNHGNDNFIVVGSGNDMKVILNISKYYTDLGEKIANEVIEKSLSQVKHHGILTEKEKPVNHDNYIFNYSGEQNDDNNKHTNQEFPSINKNSSITDDISAQIRNRLKTLNNSNESKSEAKSAQSPQKSKSHHQPKNSPSQLKNSDISDSSLTNIVKMVPLSEEDILPLDDEMIPQSKSPSPSKSTKATKNKVSLQREKTDRTSKDSITNFDDSLSISESKGQPRSKSRVKSKIQTSNSMVTDSNDGFMSSDFDRGEKKRSKIIVIKNSSGQQHRKSSNLESVSESDMQSGQSNAKKRPITLHNALLASSNSQVADSFENLKTNTAPNIRKAKSTNIMPLSSSLNANNDDQQQQHLPPVQQSPRSLKNFTNKSTSSSQTLNISRVSKNPTPLVQQKASLASSDANIAKKSADIPLTKLPKDFNDSSSVERSKKKRNILIKTSATSSNSALPISPQPTPSPFNEVVRNSHK